MNRDDLLEKALQLLKESELSDDDKALWEGQLNTADENQLEFFLTSLQVQPNVLAVATESLRKKIAVVNDPDAFTDIVRAEKEEIINMIDEK